MKFNIIYLGLILSSILSTAFCSTASEDLDVCNRTCDEFMSRVDAFVENFERSQADFDALSPYWTTCQYRCYRCYLPIAINNMRLMLKTMNDRYQDYWDKYVMLKRYKGGINYSLVRTCYDEWNKAIEENDSESTFGIYLRTSGDGNFI